MSVAATCPECSSSASVPDEAVGKKVRCKKCKATFRVEEPSSVKKRSGSKTNVSKGDSKNGKEASQSGGMKRPKKSNSTMWVIISVAVVALAAAGGGAFYAMSQSETKSDKGSGKSAKNKPRTPEEPPKPFKDDTKPSKVKNDDVAMLSKGESKRSSSKAPPQGVERTVEPTVVAELAMSGPLEYKELFFVKAVYPAANQLHLIGLHVAQDGKHFFDLYDMKKQTNVARVKLADDVDLIDLDPDAKVVATTTLDKRFKIYSLPDTGYVVDEEWAPYDRIQDKLRFLNERGGKVNSIALASTKDLFVMTSGGFGDLWELPNEKSAKFIINIMPRDSFMKEDVTPGRDFVLSPDRKRYAMATDEGIAIHDLLTNAVVVKTPSLETYGKKPSMIGMGFDPAGTKLGVYFAATAKGEGRTYFHVRFGISDGKEISKDIVQDPGDEGEVEFVNSDMFLSFNQNDATLRDAHAKTVANCRILNKSTRFAPKVVRSHVAYTFFDDKNRPSVGIVAVPLGGLVAPPPPPPPETKGKSLGELLTKQAEAPPTETKKQRVFEQQEIWEFGPKGIMRKGYKSFEKQ